MNRATYISSYLIYNNIDLVAIQAVAGALINRLYLDQPIPYDKFASVVDEAQVLLNVVPTKPVIKMARLMFRTSDLVYTVKYGLPNHRPHGSSGLCEMVGRVFSSSRVEMPALSGQC